MVMPTPAKEGMHVMRDPDREVIFQKASDYSGPTWWEDAKDKLTRLKNKATREFEYLAKTRYYAQLRADLLQLAKQKGVASPQAEADIEDITKGLNEVDYHNFVRQVVFNDWMEEAKWQQKEGNPVVIPMGMTIEELQDEIDALAKVTTPAVQAAVEKRQKKWRELRTKYITAMKAIGIDVEERLKKEHYFRRVVMDYVETSGLYGTGAALKSPTYRSFLKKRTGSEKMIYTDYIKVEHEVMAQMLYDVQLANTIKSIDDNYNEIDQFKERAVRMNYDNVIKALQAYAAAMEVPEGKKRLTGVDLYRQLGTKMAIGFDNLGRLAAADELPIGDKGEYAELVNALGENWLENADIKKEMGKDWTADDRIPLKEPYANQILGLANYILKQKEIPVGKKAAATIFKGIAERKRAVKDILGSKFMTWERLVKEHPDYTTWQPERGNIFFNVHTIPEQIAEDLMSGQFESIGISKDKIKKMLAMGGRKRQLVIHNDIAKTLDNITPRRNENWEHHRKVIKLWKMWQLGMPRRTFKYNFRNLTGDTDAVFAGNPGSIKKVKTATIQLIHLAMLRSPTYNRLAENTRTRMEEIFGKPELTDELNEWVKRGGYGTLLQAQELDHFSDVMKFGEELIRKADVKSVKDIPKKVWKGYWKAIRRATDTREAILRYASYLDYLEQMQADPNGMPKNFGGSNSEEIKGLADIRTRAFWLSNELLGAYDRVGVVGQAVREHLIPFWSWKEVLRRMALHCDWCHQLNSQRNETRIIIPADQGCTT